MSAAHGKVNYRNYHRDVDYERFEEHFRNVFELRAKRIFRFKRGPGKILDIGASTGTLLEIFKKRGWETRGVEPSGAGKVARKKGIKLIDKEFKKAGLPESYFDVVVLNHTLEHMQDPKSVLKKANKTLKKGGVVYVDVPNFASLDARLKGKKWKYTLPEEHLHHFTPTLLRHALEKAGFKVIFETTASGIFDVANPLRHFWLAARERPRAFTNDLLVVPANVITKIAGRGISLAMIGQKK